MMSWMHDCFESNRLCFSEINEADTDALVKWRSDPEIVQHFFDSKPLTHEIHLL